MDTPQETLPEPTQVRGNRFLPYLAVFQSDLHQMLQSWLYRAWVLLSVLVAAGYVLYRFGAYREAGLYHSAPELMTDLMHWLIVGSVTLIIILTSGCISSERGTMADSVLSRGISRRQYFLGKWHARLVSILGTFTILAALVLTTCGLLLRDQHMSLQGCLIALSILAALLSVVVSCGVAVSAMTNSTLLGVALVWMLLYGTGFALTFLPPQYPAPDRVLANLPNTLCGLCDLGRTYQLIGGSVAISFAAAFVGLFAFSRRDI